MLCEENTRNAQLGTGAVQLVAPNYQLTFQFCQKYVNVLCVVNIRKIQLGLVQLEA